jgi:predicted dehydrogenase
VEPPLGLGLVGAGGFGEFCLAAYVEMDEVAVVGVADMDLGRARAVAPSRARVYGEYGDLLADGDVQIVAINTPPYLHGRMARQAAEAGKHIFVSKPLATSMDEAVAAVKAARAAGVQMGIDYVLRYHPLHRLATEVIRNGGLGEFQHWSLENFAAADNLLPDHWFWDLERSGGIHVEHGVHFFDLCNHLAGEFPDEVYGCAQRRPDGRVDRASAMVRYGDRVTATFYHSFNRIGRFEETTIRVDCARGHLVIEGWIPIKLSLTGTVDKEGLDALGRLFDDGQQGRRFTIRERFHGAEASIHHGGMDDRVIAVVEANASTPDRQQAYKQCIQAGIRDLVKAIASGGSPEVGAEDGLTSLAVALAASRAGRLDEFLVLIPWD